MHSIPAVVIVAPAPPPFGGMAIQSEALRRNLLAEGFQVTTIATNPPVPFGLVDVRGVRTVLQSLIFVWQLFSVIPRADIVHVFAASYFYFFARVFPAIFIARLFGRRVIVNYRGGKAYPFFAKYQSTMRPILRLASAITVPSGFLDRCFKQQGLSCTVVPNIMDLGRFRFRRRDRLQPNLLVTRNLEPMYNIPMALRAFEIVKRVLPAARLDIVGDGSQREPLKLWTMKTQLRDVHFHGAVPHRDIARFLDRADILLNPTNVDNFPASLLEAFASGVPVVSTRVGGIPDLLGDEPAALLVDADDAATMAERIVTLIEKPEQAETMIRAGRRIAESFDWARVRETLLKVYFPAGNASMVPAQVRREQT